MVAKSKMKVYAYVDETGQDTLGDFFLVAAVVLISGRDELRKDLQEMENQSGRGKSKWTHSNKTQRQKYIELLLNNKKFKKSLFYSVFEGSKAFTDLTILATAWAINTRAVGEYKAVVFIDGLQQSNYPKYARGLRKLNIKTCKVRGLRDGSDEFIRLADSIAGFARDYIEGVEWTKLLYKKAEKEGYISKEIK